MIIKLNAYMTGNLLTHLCNYKMKIIALFFCVNISFFSSSQTLVPFLTKTGKYIFVDSISMKKVIQNEFDFAYDFNDNISIVAKNNLWGIINKQGKQLTPFKYDIIENLGKGEFKVFLLDSISNNIYCGKYGIIDSTGLVKVPVVYDMLDKFNNKIYTIHIKSTNSRDSSNNNKLEFENEGNHILSIVYNDMREGLIDNKNTMILPPIYKYINLKYINNGFFIIENIYGKRGVLDIKGNVLIKCNYDKIDYNIDNKLFYALIRDSIQANGNKFSGGSFIDEKGKTIIPLDSSLSDIKILTDGYFFNDSVIFKSSIGFSYLSFINKKENKIEHIKFKNTLINNYDNGLFYASIASKYKSLPFYGVLDKNGKIVIPFNFERIHVFSENLASVGVSTRYEYKRNSWGIGFINKQGKLVIPSIYSDASPFKGGLSKVRITNKDGKNYWGYINTTGKVVVPIIYDKVGEYLKGMVLVVLNKKIGFLDKSGNIKIPIKYDEAGYTNGGDYDINEDPIDNFKDGLLKVKINDKIGFINKNGKEIIPIKYDNVYLLNSGLIMAQIKNENRLVTFYVNRSGIEYVEK